MGINNIISAKAQYDLQYSNLYNLKGASILSFDFFKQAYFDITGDIYDEFNPFTKQAIFRQILQTDLTIAIVSNILTSELTNPVLCSGVFLDNLVSSIGITRKTNVKAKVLFQINTSSASYPYTILAGATIIDTFNNNAIAFELNTDFAVTSGLSAVFFDAISSGETYNLLSDNTGLSFAPRASTTDFNVSSFTIFSSFGGLTSETDNSLRGRYLDRPSLLSAGSTINYNTIVVDTFDIVTDVYTKNNPITERGNVSVYITLIGGQSYGQPFLDAAKITIYSLEPTTDNITFFYASPVTIDLTGINIVSSSDLLDVEKTQIVKNIQLFFAKNKINKTFYKSALQCVIQSTNSKIVQVTISSVSDSVAIGETQFQSPLYGSINYTLG